MTNIAITHFQWDMVLAPLSLIVMLVFAGCVTDRSTQVDSHGCKTSAGLVQVTVKQAFYNADGSFSGAAAKKAYFELMRAHRYPVSKLLETDQFWVCDFTQGDFTKLGMGGIFWINAKGQYSEAGAKAYDGAFKAASYGYLGHEIYLLPGQMLPEHRHVGGTEGFGPKMEGWHVRYGSAQFFGEHKSAAGETAISEMPVAERPWGYGQNWFKSKYVVTRTAGELYSQENPEAWHFFRAGPEGVIVSEYATYHNQVEFSKPGMAFKNTEASVQPKSASQGK
ncbi:MAG: hypothetical protein WCN95_02060 [bacterium]